MADITKGTPVQDPIVPGTNDQNTWATHYAKYGVGGFLIVANDTERDSISPERRVDKMIYNKATGKFNHHNGTTWVDTAMGNTGVTQDVLDAIKANTDDIKRIKTNIAKQPTEIYSYRGTTAPYLPDGKRGYYLSFYALKDNAEQIQIPDVLADGTIICINNEDNNNVIKVLAESGSTIGDNSATSISVSVLNMIFLIKNGIKWVVAFEGIIPKDLNGIINEVKKAIPATVTLSISEIEAQLKDRLHTFAEIQKEFASQLHTLTDLEMNGFEKFTYEYGFLYDTSVPTDNAWKLNQARLGEPTDIPVQDAGLMILALSIPVIAEPLIKGLKVNGALVNFTSHYYAVGNVPRMLLITNDEFDTSAIVKVQFEIGIEKGTGGDTGIGVKGDIPSEVYIGITDLEMPNSIVEVDPNEDTKAVIKPYIITEFPTTDEENPSNVQEFKTTSIKFLPPLKGFSDPNAPLGAIVEVDHRAYNEQHAVSYLAYLDRSQLLKSFDGTTDPVAFLWFDDVVYKNSVNEIQIDKIKKTFGLQEYDSLDPNITGGINYYVGFKLAATNIAGKTGKLEVMLWNVKDNAIAEDVNGNPITNSVDVEVDQAIPSVVLDGVINAKGLTDYKFKVKSTCGEVRIASRDNGLTGIIIQSLNGDEKTSPAFLQWCKDIQRNPIITVLKLGYNFLSMPDITILKENGLTHGKIHPAKYNVHTVDGWNLYSEKAFASKIDEPNKIIYFDNSSFISFGIETDNALTKLLRSSKVKVITTVVPVSPDFLIMALSYTGDPDDMTYPVIKGFKVDGSIDYNTGWARIDSYTVNKNTASDLTAKEVEADFDIPADANNLSFLIMPSTSSSVELGIKNFNVTTSGDFTQRYSIEHKTFHDISYKTMSCRIDHDNTGSGLETITSTPTIVPIGKVTGTTTDVEGSAPVNFNRGSNRFDILETGNFLITVSTSLRGAKDEYSNTRFYAEKFDSDGNSLGEVKSSRRLFTLPDSLQSRNRTATFLVPAEKGEYINFFCVCDDDDDVYFEFLRGTVAHPNVAHSVSFVFFPIHSGMSDYSANSSTPADAGDGMILTDEEGGNWLISVDTEGRLTSDKQI